MVKTSMVGVIVVIVVAVVAIGAYVAMQPAAPTTTTTSTTTTSTTTQTTTTTTATPLKVAMVSISPAGDMGWADMNKSMTDKAAELGYETSFTGLVSDADLESVVTTYIDRGYNVIGLGSATFGPIIDSKVAAEHPEVTFISFAMTDDPVNSNMMAFEFLREEGSFTVGALFTKLTESNKVGSIGGIDYPVVVRSHEAFQAGVHWAIQGNWDTANPTVEVKTLYCGSWIDPTAGRTSAQTLIDEGYDCLVGQADSSTVGVIDAANEAGIVAVSYNDYHLGWELSPDMIVSVVAIRADRMIEMVLENLEAGNGIVNHWRPGLASGVVEVVICPNWDSKLTTTQKDYLQTVQDAIINGEVEVPYVLEKSGVPPADF